MKFNMKFIPISQETVIFEIHSHFTRNSNLLRIPKGTPNFTTISARVWNEIVTKIIMDQHVSISKFKTMLKSYLLVSSFTLTYTK